MKYLGFAAAFLALSLVGCGGQSLYRGIDGSGSSFVSTAAPSLAVLPAKGFSSVISGRDNINCAVTHSLARTIPVSLSYGLWQRDGSQLAVVFAETDQNWKWAIGATGADYQSCKVLSQKYGVMAGDFSTVTYIRPHAMDPWLPLLKEGSDGWEGDILVARSECLYTSDTKKFIVEYREPISCSVEEFMYHPEYVDAFLKRASEAFSTISADSAVRGNGTRVGGRVSDELLAHVLGSIDELQLEKLL